MQNKLFSVNNKSYILKISMIIYFKKIKIFLPGKLSVKLQGIIYSPPAIGNAPISWFILLTSLFGPAKREVPVSAIAWQPPWQKSESLRLILKFFS